MEHHINNNPELAKIIQSGDKEALIKYLQQNKDLAASMLADLANFSKPAEKYIRNAIDKIHDDEDFLGAIQIINEGLTLNDKKNEHFLFKLRAECQLELMNYNDALNDINKGIQSLKQNRPDDYYEFSTFLNYRAEIKQLLRDIEGAKQDRLLAEEYDQKYEANKPESGDEDDVPF